MEDVVHTSCGSLEGGFVAHIAYIELYLVCHLWTLSLILVTHIVLFLLVTAEYADFLNIRFQKTVKHCISETAGTTGNHQSFVFKNRHNYIFFVLQ